MKLRPQFNLRFHDIKEFEAVMDAAEKSDESMNETVLIKMRSGFGWAPWEENNGKEKVAEVAAEKAGEIGRENRPAGIQSVGVGGKGGSVRAPKKGFEVGNNAEIATGGSAGVAAAGISPEGKRGVQKGVAGDHGKLLRGQSGAAFNERAQPENPIETDAVGTTGCKVTVSRPMAGRPAHAGNCQCLTCKPPKENK